MADATDSKKYDRIVKIHKADIPENMQVKAILRVNQGMDKFQIEKVRTSLRMGAPPPAPGQHTERWIWRLRHCCEHRPKDAKPLSSNLPCPPIYTPIVPHMPICAQDISTYVKKKFDEEFGGTWHVVCGRNFGCSITHDTKFLLFFQIDLVHCMLFKSLD